jgi:hypothetical protein
MNLPIMKSQIKKSLSGMEARFWVSRFLALGLLAFGCVGWLIADEQNASSDLTVHEWGTFTAIAGKDGRAMEWATLGSPRFGPSADLPRFVEHIGNASFKAGLRGTIRMGHQCYISILHGM